MSKDTMISSGSIVCWQKVENDFLSCWYVVLFVYHMVLVFLQHTSVLRRVEFLCMTP